MALNRTRHADAGPRYASVSDALGDALPSLPYALRILVENCLTQKSDPECIDALVARRGDPITIMPSRLILQDMLALPLLLDIMALRDALTRAGVSTEFDLKIPADLVIDHSMTLVDWAGPDALRRNQEWEFEINAERFAFFKACEAEFEGLRIIPPGGGIMHQVNLEFLGRVVEEIDEPSGALMRADIVMGTDSHTPMINGLGILGWGIGGLDAEALLFGKPLTLNTPEVIGLRVTGSLAETVTATDLALRLAERLREEGVVGSFVEVFGPGYSNLSVPDRATAANMAPEYGATCFYCPIDDRTIHYLAETGRSREHIERVKDWALHQHLWHRAEEAEWIDYERVIELDLSKIVRSVSGPSRPEQRLDLNAAPRALSTRYLTRSSFPVNGADYELAHGDVVIAAITSCTNTANPRNIVLAGLVARKAVALGLKRKPWIKTSLAPGSRVVAEYLRKSGLQDALDALGFHIAGFACTTCNGMSGPLAPEVEKTIRDHNLECAAILSGNRNFSGRIHPDARQNVLASPPLVVAYAIAGSIRENIATTTLGHDKDDHPVTLADLWPERTEVDAVLAEIADPEGYRSTYAAIGEVSGAWSALKTEGVDFQWPEASTYITRPPFLDDISDSQSSTLSLTGLRPLAMLGDNITTDHISPSGYITVDSAAGKYLRSRGVKEPDFNSYGTRRGSNEIVARSTFANPRLENEMADGKEGSVTTLWPDGQAMSVFEAIEIYRSRGVGLVIIGGKNYGGGSSRDTAAKAPWLAGVKAVIAESFERIHRSNLLNMGIAPLLFSDDQSRHDLQLKGNELLDLELGADLEDATLIVRDDRAHVRRFGLSVAFQNDTERRTFLHGGLLRETF